MPFRLIQNKNEYLSIHLLWDKNRQEALTLFSIPVQLKCQKCSEGAIKDKTTLRKMDSQKINMFKF